MKEVGIFGYLLPPPFIHMLRQCFSRRTLSPTPTPMVHCLVLPVSNFSDDRRTSKRPAKEVDNMNIGAESLFSSRQAGTAHSPASSSSSSSKRGNSENGEVLHVVEGLMKIAKIGARKARLLISDVSASLFGKIHLGLKRGTRIR